MERIEEDEKAKSEDKEDKPFVLGEEEKKPDEKDDKTNEEGKPMELSISKEQMELQKKAKEYLEAKNSSLGAEGTKEGSAENAGTDNAEGKKKGRKRKRTKDFDNDDESSEESSEEEADEDVPPGMEKKAVGTEDKKDDDVEPIKEVDTVGTSDELNDQSKENQNGKDEENKQDECMGDENTKECDNTEKEDGEESKMPEDEGIKPRPLHKVTSIFLRNLSPTITKQEVEAMCRRYPGFLRAAIADPQPERRWFRRGWVTFERDIKIKDICFNLNNIRLR